MNIIVSRVNEGLRLPIWARLGGQVGRIFSFIVISLCMLVITFLVSFDKLLPGTIFKFPTFIGLILLPFVLAYIMVPTTPSKKRDNPGKLSKKWRKVIILGFLAYMLAILGIYAYQINQDNRQLAEANRILTISLVGHVSSNRVDSTLIELDAQLSRLDKLYGLEGGEQKIGLVLFPDIETLKDNTDVPKWADAYISFASGKPVIYLPAEQPPSDSSRKSNPMASPMPGHEITHYVIRKKVGENNISRIPLWFNEGLAQYESLKGFDRGLDRIGYKLDLWLINLSNPDILKSGELILLSSNYPVQNIRVFYLASMEFVTYVANHYGSMNNVLQGVAAGEEFEIAFREETGKSCQEAYDEWRLAFFGY